MDLRDLMKTCFMRRLNGMSAPVLLSIALVSCGAAALPAPAQAETSTNLEIRQERNMHGEVIRETFIDREGNPVMADDTQYAYVQYRYNDFPALVETTYHALDGEHVNTA